MDLNAWGANHVRGKIQKKFRLHTRGTPAAAAYVYICYRPSVARAVIQTAQHFLVRPETKNSQT